MEEILRRSGEVDPTVFVGVGLLAFAINFLATYEVQKIQQKDAVKAATAAAANCVLGSLLLYAFVSQPLNGISEVAGTYLGVYLQIKRGRIRP